MPSFGGNAVGGKRALGEDAPLRRAQTIDESMGESAEAAAVAHASPVHVDEAEHEEPSEEKGVNAEAEAAGAPQAVLPVTAAKVVKGAPPTSKGEETKQNGKAAMALVLSAVSKRDAAKVLKRPAASSSGGKAKKPNTEGKAYYKCEWSREQFMGRTGESGPGTTKGFPFKEYGGMEKAMKACEAWVDACNAKKKP